MSLGMLEYNELCRVADATTQMARNMGSMVSMNEYNQLVNRYNEMLAERNSWKADCAAISKNRDEFETWGIGLKEKLAASRLRAEEAEARAIEFRDMAENLVGVTRAAEARAQAAEQALASKSAGA